MNKDARIFVAGHQGMVGSALVRRLRGEGYENLLLAGRDVLDLREPQQVGRFFEQEKPEHVVLAAAKVGGIHANNTYPAEFIYDNLVIQNNVIHASWESSVERLLFLGSSCIYPKLAPQPLPETCLLTGELEATNEPYAIAKIAGIKMCEAYNRQYGTKFAAVMPTNLYGPEDNFHLENSHVLPALLRRLHAAKQAQAKEVLVWGSGKPRREFLHVDDMASACVYILQLDERTFAQTFLSYPEPCFVNVGMGKDLTIRELAETISEVVGYKGQLSFDVSKPEGTPRKLLDVSRMSRLGWRAETELRDGIEQTYGWFLNNCDRFREA